MQGWDNLQQHPTPSLDTRQDLGYGNSWLMIVATVLSTLLNEVGMLPVQFKYTVSNDYLLQVSGTT